MTVTTTDTANRTLAAIACALGGVAILGFTDNFSRVSARDAGLWQFHAFRAGMVVPMLLVALWLTGAAVRPQQPVRVLVRSIVMGLAMFCYFGSLAILPISVAVAGYFTAPIFVLILSVLVMRLHVGPWRWLAAAAGFAGIVIVIRPDPSALDPRLLLPLAAGFLYAVTVLMTRAWCQNENTLVLTGGSFLAMFTLGVIGLAVLTAVPGLQGESYFLQGFVRPSGSYLAVIALQAVGGMAGVGLLVRAYQLGEASYVVIFEYSLMIFASFWAWVLWSEQVDALAFAGMALIVVSGGVIALRSR